MTPQATSPAPLDGIMLAAIRYRAGEGHGQSVEDRAWLLRYIDRTEAEATAAVPLDARRLHEVGQPHTDPLTAESCRRLYYGLCERIIARLASADEEGET